MSISRFKAALAAVSMIGACAAMPAQASVTYNYALDVTSTNIAGLADGTLSFTLSAAPTSVQMAALTDIKAELTAFDAQIDGFDFNTFTNCGAHPTGCVSNLEFITGGNLWNLTYTGQSTARTDVTLTLNNTVFSHFYIQSSGQYADGNLVFLNNDPIVSGPPLTVPEPSSLALLLGGLAAVAGAVLARGRKAVAA
jgi:hypothetical protein